jgi:hypothetical protein
LWVERPSRVSSPSLEIMTRPGHAKRSGVEVIPPTRRRSFPRLSVAGCARGRRQKATAPLERRSLAVSPPLHRNYRPPLPSAAPTPEPRFEIENLGRRAQADPQQSLRRQERDMVTGGAIDLDEVTQPKVLDPRGVEGEHSGSPKFLECSHRSRRGCDCQRPGQALSFARPLRVIWRRVLRRGFPRNRVKARLLGCGSCVGGR